MSEVRGCTKCLLEKPFGSFHKMRRGRYGLSSWCKSCMATAGKTWRAANKERVRARDAVWRAANPEKTYAYRLKSVHGITVEQREALGTECHICGSQDSLSIDHDHACCPGSDKACGECLRGLLCRKCNLALGHFDDDVDKLRAAIIYLGESA